PMVLGPQGPGRVGRCQANNSMTLHSHTQVVEKASTAFFIFPSFNITSYKYIMRICKFVIVTKKGCSMTFKGQGTAFYNLIS
ncbi:hypothetical protein C1I59_10585, partial [Paenibacillus polymyxa]